MILPPPFHAFFSALIRSRTIGRRGHAGGYDITVPISAQAASAGASLAERSSSNTLNSRKPIAYRLCPCEGVRMLRRLRPVSTYAATRWRALQRAAANALEPAHGGTWTAERACPGWRRFAGRRLPNACRSCNTAIPPGEPEFPYGRAGREAAGRPDRDVSAAPLPPEGWIRMRRAA